MSDALEVLRLKHTAGLLIAQGSDADPQIVEQLESALSYLVSTISKEDTECVDLLKGIEYLRAEAFKSRQTQVEESSRNAFRNSNEDQDAKAISSSSIALESLKPKFKPKSDAEASAVFEDRERDTASATKMQALLLQQKDLATQALEQERRDQALLSEEVNRLTSVLKEAALQMNRSVLEQNAQLDSLQTVAADNQAELDKQASKTKEQVSTMTTSMWATVGAVAWLVVMFIATYVVIRLFPKPRHGSF
jgi:hypothetical protein